MARTQCKPLTKAESTIVGRALEILKRHMHRETMVIGSPGAARQFLTLQYGAAEIEFFSMICLDTQNRVIACDEMFRGSLAQTSVFPREVVRTALRHNAASVVFAHNHPSGVSEPSGDDQHLTYLLKQALALVDVQVLDHFVIGGASIMSFAERGLLEKPPPIVETTKKKDRKARRRRATKGRT